ncbi:MAG: helix-turn-helix domain-containing protein [Ilumatobacter sp.]|nr:helix-turn-helix domain-containing protein [Ilumatobacter sp.]
MDRVGTGFDSLDAALGGLISGDNVAWICDDPDLYRSLAIGLVNSAARPGRSAVLVSFRAERLLAVPGATTIDATPGSENSSAGHLVDAIERHVKRHTPTCLVVDDLAAVIRRWGVDAVSAFFERVCPAMLDAGVTAYWQVGSALGASFTEHARQITQCLLDVRHDRLRVLKAEGRPDALQDISYRLRHDAGWVEVIPAPAGGRLARGLTTVRKELGLTQQELAEAAGVTASAISQAESGSRGLSLDTVVTLADRLDVSVDRLLAGAHRRPYHLTRHDRARVVSNSTIVALATDATVGLRLFLVKLPGDARQPPPFDHRGVAAVASVQGLIQVELDDDRPVLRAGDVLIVEGGRVHSWRNLRGHDAACYWIMRD